MRLTLDSNILIYAQDRSAGSRHAQAMALVGRATATDCILTLQSLAETFRVSVTRLAMSAAEAKAALAVWRRAFPIHAATLETLDAAIGAVDRHQLSFWDAMLWATAREAGCEAILSEDFQDGRTLGGLQFVNPFNAENAALLDRLFEQ